MPTTERSERRVLPTRYAEVQADGKSAATASTDVHTDTSFSGHVVTRKSDSVQLRFAPDEFVRVLSADTEND